MRFLVDIHASARKHGMADEDIDMAPEPLYVEARRNCRKRSAVLDLTWQFLFGQSNAEICAHQVPACDSPATRTCRGHRASRGWLALSPEVEAHSAPTN